MAGDLIEKIKQGLHGLHAKLIPEKVVDVTEHNWNGTGYGIAEKKITQTGEKKFDACIYGIVFLYHGSTTSPSLLDGYVNEIVFREALAEEDIFKRGGHEKLPYLDLLKCPHGKVISSRIRVPVLSSGNLLDVQLKSRAVINVYNKYSEQICSAIAAAEQSADLPGNIDDARRFFRSAGLTYLEEKKQQDALTQD